MTRNGIDGLGKVKKALAVSLDRHTPSLPENIAATLEIKMRALLSELNQVRKLSRSEVKVHAGIE
jgi:hypothetical protein